MEALLIAALIACPAAVSQQLDGLYRWQIERQNSPSPRNLSSQRQRFTPELYQQLQQGFAQTPAQDGRFVDFDVFSGTQVTTFGAKVSGCTRLKAGSINAEVSVDTGLGGAAAADSRNSWSTAWCCAMASGTSLTSTTQVSPDSASAPSSAHF